MKVHIISILLLLILTNCTSVEKYNNQVVKKHAIIDLKKDVDIVYSKLKKLHPNLYQYISKDSLDYYFQNYKNSIDKPMNSLEFYYTLSPIISKIGQGHTYLYSAHSKQTKKEIKKNGKRKNPFSLFRFNKINDNIYIEKNFSKDSTILVGSQLMKIDNKNVDILTKYFKLLTTGDGYNKTFMQEIPYKFIGNFYEKVFRHKDSLKLTLKTKDSIYQKYIYAYKKKESKKTDSTSQLALTKLEKKKKKKKVKERYTWEQKYGYSKITKEKTLSLKFLKNKDSTKNIAYLKIRSFSKGNYKDFFEETFKRIDSAKVDNLIIDLRDNLGGRLSEIADLYSYLSKEDSYQFLNAAKMTKANSFSYPFLHNKSVISKVLMPLTFPITKVIQILKVKKIDGKSHFVFKAAKQQKAKELHRYKGKIYVLINGTSFSASAIISNKLQAKKRAYFVGVETGGAYNSTVAGYFAKIELPTTKNVLRVGLMVIETQHKATPDGYGVMPDKEISVTTLAKDEQLDWILNDIK